MKVLVLSALLAAPGQSPWFWVPPADGGALEVLGVPGGWTVERETPVRFQVTSPGDPRPKRTADRSWWDYYQEEQQARQAALLQAVKARLPNEAPASWRLLPLLDWSPREVPEADRKTATPAEVAFLARYVEARAEAEGELEAADHARSRELLAWFNGRPERLLVAREDEELAFGLDEPETRGDRGALRRRQRLARFRLNPGNGLVGDIFAVKRTWKVNAVDGGVCVALGLGIEKSLHRLRQRLRRSPYSQKLRKEFSALWEGAAV